MAAGDGSDFGDFGAAFGSTGAGSAFDFNNDNTVDATDFFLTDVYDVVARILESVGPLDGAAIPVEEVGLLRGLVRGGLRQ